MSETQRIRFDGTITTGNILTVVSMLAAMAMLYVNMENRVMRVEERTANMSVTVNRTADSLDRLTSYVYQNRQPYHKDP